MRSKTDRDTTLMITPEHRRNGSTYADTTLSHWVFSRSKIGSVTRPAPHHLSRLCRLGINSTSSPTGLLKMGAECATCTITSAATTNNTSRTTAMVAAIASERRLNQPRVGRVRLL